MAAQISQNRQMFWRITRRMIGAHRGRLFVVLLALGAGAAVTAALLNLQVDARHRLSTDFGIFGPNALITPRDGETTLSESTFDQLPLGSRLPNATASLSFVGEVVSDKQHRSMRAVITGIRPLRPMGASGRVTSPSSESEPHTGDQSCIAGGRLASGLHLKVGDDVILRNETRQETCSIRMIRLRGDVHDDQIMPSLGVAQRLADLPGRLSVIELTLRTEPGDQALFLADLQRRFSKADIHPLREFSQAQANIYDRISGLLTLTIAVVLVLTALCVMAAMTNVAMERKNDVGLMKAIGGATRRVLRLFLAEAALLGLAGGALGAAAGILLSIWLGKQVFGVAAQPRLIVYPVAVVLTVMVAILSAFPLRRLASVRPASVFRGEA
jgi:ABC-type lipoprotein release transport system permease subunit